MSEHNQIQKPEQKEAIPIINGRLEPQSLGGMVRIADMLMLSGMMSTVKNREQALVLVVAACELKLSYIDTLTGLAIVNGKPMLHSRLPMALAIRTGQFNGVDVKFDGVGDGLTCFVTVRRRYADGTVCAFDGEFSMADAKKAGLMAKDNWQKYPRDMLKARAMSRALGMGFADAFGGMGTVQPDDEEAVFNAGTRRAVVNEAATSDAAAAIDAIGEMDAGRNRDDNAHPETHAEGPGRSETTPDAPPPARDDDFAAEMAGQMDQVAAERTPSPRPQTTTARRR
jgi:hypothetical protein